MPDSIALPGSGCCATQCALFLVGAYLVLSLLRRALFVRPNNSSVDAKTREYLEKGPEEWILPPASKEVAALRDGLLAYDDDSIGEQQCADAMRKVLMANHLSYRSLQDAPGKLLEVTPHIGTGKHGALHTRFTVSYNLYGGSIVALGNQTQRDALYAQQSTGQLGCFAFTEKGAGVISGAACETTATLDVEKKEWVIHAPTASAAKNWISQGAHAEWAVILANLIDGSGTNRGPHLFWARIGTRET